MGKIVPYKPRPSTRGRIAWNRGKPFSIEVRKKMSESAKLRRDTLETRFKKRESHLKRVASGLHHNYKGGIETENNKIRKSLEYRIWRESVFERDNYSCVLCKKRGCVLNADHIKPFALFPELRFDLDNGRTLCLDCHLKTDTHGWKTRRLAQTVV